MEGQKHQFKELELNPLCIREMLDFGGGVVLRRERLPLPCGNRSEMVISKIDVIFQVL